MKKTDRILQYLDGIDGPLPGAADIAAAIDDADGIDRTKALLTYLAGHGKVEKITDGRDVAWRITEAGREALAEATEDAPAAPAKKVVHRAPPQRVAKKPARKLQRAAAVLQPVATVESTPLAPITGRAIAVREDGAILVLDGDAVVSTLVPDDARRIAAVVNRMMGVTP